MPFDFLYLHKLHRYSTLSLLGESTAHFGAFVTMNRGTFNDVYLDSLRCRCYMGTGEPFRWWKITQQRECVRE